MKKIFIDQIKERDWVEAPFLVRDKIVGMAKNGRPYLTLKLLDRTGEVEGRVWDRVDELSACFEKDDFIKVAGKASVYMGKMQLVIQQLDRLNDDDIELADFLPVSDRPMAEMVAELKERVASLEDPHLNALMQAFLDDDDFMQCYTKAPAAKTMHHVFLGGLMEHSLAVAALADDISLRYPGLNRDLLLVGALLHDVGKTDELRYERSFEYTDAGKLLGHIMIGVEIVEEKLRTLPDFPRETAVLLKHLLLSHHGQYEYGSPKRPKTMEAVILNFIDDLDAKVNGVQTHIDKEPDRESAWTNYHRLYDRYFFKGFPSMGSDELPRQEKPLSQAEPGGSRGKKSGKQPRPRFSNTLEEQLRGKDLNLFNTVNQEKENE